MMGILNLIKDKIKPIIASKSEINMVHVPERIISVYGANDSIVTLKLFNYFKDKFSDSFSAYREVMMQYYWGYRLQLNSIFLDYDKYFEIENELMTLLSLKTQSLKSMVQLPGTNTALLAFSKNRQPLREIVLPVLE